MHFPENIQKTARLTFCYRTSRLLLHVLTGVVLSAVLLPCCTKRFTNRIIQWWSKSLINIFNIQIHAQGHVPSVNSFPKGSLFVANHISWVDIHALMSLIPLRFIAKSDIKDWPVFGYLAAKANVLFIERGKRSEAGRIVNTAYESLMAHEHLCYFPEGTTTDGTHMLPFKGSLMQAAINAKTTIQPVAIFYPLASKTANVHMAYAGDTSMLASMYSILWQAKPTVELNFFAPIHLAALNKNFLDRRQLTQSIELLIKQHLYPQ